MDSIVFHLIVLLRGTICQSSSDTLTIPGHSSTPSKPTGPVATPFVTTTRFVTRVTNPVGIATQFVTQDWVTNRVDIVLFSQFVGLEYHNLICVRGVRVVLARKRACMCVCVCVFVCVCMCACSDGAAVGYY